jgi:hypothetical protein
MRVLLGSDHTAHHPPSSRTSKSTCIPQPRHKTTLPPDAAGQGARSGAQQARTQSACIMSFSSDSCSRRRARPAASACRCAFGARARCRRGTGQARAAHLLKDLDLRGMPARREPREARGSFPGGLVRAVLLRPWAEELERLAWRASAAVDHDRPGVPARRPLETLSACSCSDGQTHLRIQPPSPPAHQGGAALGVENHPREARAEEHGRLGREGRACRWSDDAHAYGLPDPAPRVSRATARVALPPPPPRRQSRDARKIIYRKPFSIRPYNGSLLMRKASYK